MISAKPLPTRLDTHKPNHPTLQTPGHAKLVVGMISIELYLHSKRGELRPRARMSQDVELGLGNIVPNLS